ncbi:MAG TPA: TonB-dependent receptor [Longimicrobiales bacterium]
MRRFIPLLRTLACALCVALAVLARPTDACAQGTASGRVLGIVTDSATGLPIAGAGVSIVGRPQIHTVTDADGRFILATIPLGTRDLLVEMVGYASTTLRGITIRSGTPLDLAIALTATPVEVDGIVVQGERVRVVEPEVVASHEIYLGRELRDLPVDAIEEAIELAPGVSDGHFRGGRVGQETYVVDGLAIRNQLEGSAQGSPLELAPTSLEEIEVVTGGFGAEHGSALSGVVSLATRRGDPDRWTGGASLRTDEWAPADLFHGFTMLDLNAGGPIPFLGRGTTLFVDLSAYGMGDADPRARGLACVREGDGDDALDERIAQLRAETPQLYCPYSATTLPHQHGDKLIGFVRLDRPLFPGVEMTTSLLWNRTQQELYTPELKYADEYRLGQRNDGGLAQLSFDWARHVAGRALHLTARGAAMRLDRHLGVVDPAWRDDRTLIAGVSPSSFEFLGEDFVHSPVNEQLASGQAVPGYVAPDGTGGTPFGLAADGLFITRGASGLANWSRTEMVGTDLVGEMLQADGALLRGGASTRFFRVQAYERTQAWLGGSALRYARFFPATATAFGEYRLIVADEFQIQFGLRVEAFRSGIGLPEDPDDFTAPMADSEWKLSVLPRIGFAGAIPATDGQGSFKLSYSRVAQPPDFRFFLDTTIGDSLRTDISRQGNPALGFEEGRAYEIGGSWRFSPEVGLTVTAFRKDLLEMVSGAITFDGGDEAYFTTGDRGTVNGIEASLRARHDAFGARLAYTLQKATGVGSGAFEGDSVVDDDMTVEYPLSFDRRHAVDAAVLYGQAAGVAASPWSATATATVHSGYPFDRRVAAGVEQANVTYLPWNATVDLRASRDLGSLGCASCTWRITLDARNVLGRDNVIALRRDNATLAPSVSSLDSTAAATPFSGPIPRESPRYTTSADLNEDGYIVESEYRTARFAAALDRSDPSLFYGEARQVRLGLEVRF